MPRSAIITIRKGKKNGKVKAIDKLTAKATCNPDGWSASLVKGLRDPLAKLLCNI